VPVVCVEGIYAFSVGQNTYEGKTLVLEDEGPHEHGLMVEWRLVAHPPLLLYVRNNLCPRPNRRCLPPWVWLKLTQTNDWCSMLVMTFLR
jgi:hypothetical protein